MRFLFLHDVQKLLDSDITGLVLLYLLALSTFLAGIYLDWRLGVEGLFLVVSALALAFLDEVGLSAARPQASNPRQAVIEDEVLLISE